MTKIHVEVVHDLVCSWCPIGYRNLQVALQNLNFDAQISFIPFEINPEMNGRGELIEYFFERRFSWSKHRIKAYQTSLLKTAKQAGVDINFDKRVRYFNTNKAHRLMYLAKKYDKHIMLNDVLADAYFTHGENISNEQVLLRLGQQVGLDVNAVEHVLKSDAADEQFKLSAERLKTLGLDSVPAFIVNGQHILSGSNSVVYFENALLLLLEKERGNNAIY